MASRNSVPGENPRLIYWKRSARTGELVSKEMVQISPPRLLIMVDGFIESPTLAEHAAVEKAIAMAASLASRAMDSGMAVGLCTWAGDWTSIAPQRGKRHCRDILAALAALPINRTVPAGQLLAQAKELSVRAGDVACFLRPARCRWVCSSTCAAE